MSSFNIKSFMDFVNKQSQFLNHIAIEVILNKLTTHSNTNIKSNVSQAALLALELFEVSKDVNPSVAFHTAAILLPFHHDLNQPFFKEDLDNEAMALLSQAKLIFSLEDVLLTEPELNTVHRDKVRKMLLAIAGDPRAIMLTMYYHICLIKSFKSSEAIIQQKEATIIRDLYAPLANRLGIGHLKWQLEDLSFRHLNTKAYYEIRGALNMRRVERDQYVLNLQKQIDDLIKKTNIKRYECFGRAKHIYSIYRKCHKKNIAYDKLYDAIALRILVPTVEDCYHLLGVINEAFEVVPHEFDDYIAKPKPNGYQSIHTAIEGDSDQYVEIQLRTFDMHDLAELGACAHWLYKENTTSATHYEDKISQLRHLIDWQQGLHTDPLSDKAKDSTTISELFADRIYVFSPKGKIVDLPAQATVLDFAYHIHTDIGHRTKGATVNGKQTPLNYCLHNGDRVDIQTKKIPQPSRDWLNSETKHVTTKRARQKIAHWFRAQHNAEHFELGKSLWEKTSRSKNLSKNSLQQVLPHFNFKSIHNLLIALGAGDISIVAILQHLNFVSNTAKPQEELATERVSTVKQFPSKPIKVNDSVIEVAGVNQVLSAIAKCCLPIPGDKIIGYMTTTRGLLIHQRSCKNVLRLIQTNPTRILPATWNNISFSSFYTSIDIIAMDRVGLLHDITSCFSQLKFHIENIQISHPKKYKPYTCIRLELILNNKNQLNSLSSTLLQINDIMKICRSK